MLLIGDDSFLLEDPYKILIFNFTFSFFPKTGVIKMKIPICCGKRMEIEADLGRFVMVGCKKCGSVVYIKKEEKKPELIEFMG